MFTNYYIVVSFGFVKEELKRKVFSSMCFNFTNAHTECVNLRKYNYHRKINYETSVEK